MDHDFSRTIIVSTAAFLALLLLSVYLSVVRQRARRRRFLERSIRWHFPAFDCDRPPALPLAVRHGPSGTAGISFSRFSWAEGKVLPTYDYKDPIDFLDSDRTIDYPEPAVVRVSKDEAYHVNLTSIH